MIADTITSIFILFLSLVLLNQTKQYNYLSAIFPQFVIVFLMILTVILLVRAIVFLKMKHKPSESRLVSLKDLFYIFLVLVLSFLWVYVMDWVLGFLLGSILFGVVVFAILAGKSLKLYQFILFSLSYCAIVFIFWYALGKLLRVPLPRGLFF